jgi:OOP family OmpA-OmpF porin
MKLPNRLLVVAVAMMFLSLLPAASHAENKYHVFTLTPFVGGRLFEGNQALDDSPVGGIALGYNLSEVWSVEGLFGYSRGENRLGRNVDVCDARVDVLYHFKPYRALVPYLAGGIGALFLKTEHEEADNDLQLNFGAGIKFFISENIALRADLRPVLDINVGDSDDRPDTYWNLLCTAGLTFQLGTPPATREYLDTDEDGVLDAVDECLATPPGVPVNRRGCVSDSDRDGVPDYRDLCPDSTEGAAVNASGCPAAKRCDSDGDGVEDRLDHCPDSPCGPVNAVGCPMGRHIPQQPRATR